MFSKINVGEIKRVNECQSHIHSFRSIRDRVVNVLLHQARGDEANAVSVHQPQEIASSLIDKGHTDQVNRERPVRMACFSEVPAILQLADSCASKPAFELQAQCARVVMNGYL